MGARGLTVVGLSVRPQQQFGANRYSARPSAPGVASFNRSRSLPRETTQSDQSAGRLKNHQSRAGLANGASPLAKPGQPTARFRWHWIGPTNNTSNGAKNLDGQQAARQYRRRGA